MFSLVKICLLLMLSTHSVQASFAEIYEDSQQMSRRFRTQIGNAATLASVGLAFWSDTAQTTYKDAWCSDPDTSEPSYGYTLTKMTTISIIGRLVAEPFINNASRLYAACYYSKWLFDTQLDFHYGDTNPARVLTHIGFDVQPSLKARIDQMKNRIMSDEIFALLYVLHHKKELTTRGVPQLNSNGNVTDIVYDCGNFNIFLARHENLDADELLDPIFTNQAQAKINYFKNKIANSYILDTFNYLMALSQSKDNTIIDKTVYEYCQLKNKDSIVIGVEKQFYIGITSQH